MARKSKRKSKPIAQASSSQLSKLIVDDWRTEVDKFVVRICDSLALLSEDDIWWRPNDASNSIGNMVLHLCGNMRQWIIAGLGGEPDVRERDLEFSERGPIPCDDLQERLRAVVKKSSAIVACLSPDALAKTYSIQGYRVSGYVAANHVASHVSYHAAQIIYITKMKRGEDLGFTKLAPVKAKPKK